MAAGKAFESAKQRHDLSKKFHVTNKALRVKSVGIGGLGGLDTLAYALMHAGQQGGRRQEIPQGWITHFCLVLSLRLFLLIRRLTDCEVCSRAKASCASFSPCSSFTVHQMPSFKRKCVDSPVCHLSMAMDLLSYDLCLWNSSSDSFSFKEGLSPSFCSKIN